MSSGFHTITLGCKLNRFDTAAIEGELVRRGLEPQQELDAASVVVINTCTVTGKADAEARRLIRGVRRRNRHCRLLVTGCYAELDPRAIRSIPGVDLVFGNRDKPELARLLDEQGIGRGDRGCDGAPGIPAGLHFGERSRAFLRVQQGCDLRCSYCVIPTVRGPSRSVAPELVERSLERLLASGYREVVLTGVNTGDYGKDLVPRTDLASLLRRLLRMAGPNRIRLNSLEPRTVTEEIISLMADDPRLAPHLQVPLQSGADPLLRRMRRNYRVGSYLERVEAVRRAVPHAGLGADVIVGFPGETDALFDETLRFVEASPLNYLHVFSWSPRPGTAAAALPERPPRAVVRQRSAALRELGQRLGRRFRAGFAGRLLDAVVLERRGDGAVRALSGNYIELRVRAEDARPGRREPILARVTRVEGDVVNAAWVGRPAWASADPVATTVPAAPGP